MKVLILILSGFCLIFFNYFLFHIESKPILLIVLINLLFISIILTRFNGTKIKVVGKYMFISFLGLLAFVVIRPYFQAPKIDTSTTEKYEQSIAEVYSSLSDSKKSKFKGALAVININSIDMLDIVTINTENNIFDEVEKSNKRFSESLQEYKDILHGKTAQEIIEISEEYLKRSEKNVNQ